MNNLLKAESYKLMYNKSFWGLFLFSFVLGSIMLFDSNRLTNDMLNASLYNTPLMYFLIIIFAVPFIGEDFGNRTIHSFVSGGHKRMDILQNLLTNAVRYSSEKIQIRLCKSEENRVTLYMDNSVQDAGKLDVDRLFERFYTGDSSRHSESTGLGLAIVKILVEKIGGSISASVQSDMLSIQLTF